jgi:protocatechuate 3,4-dioxygenase beta subunit
MRAMVWVACLVGALLAVVAWRMSERSSEGLDGGFVHQAQVRGGEGPELLGHAGGGASAPGSASSGAHPTSVEGRVVSKAGDPIAGASVWCVHSQDAIDADALRGDVLRTTTDAGGRFRLVSDRRAVDLAASAPGFVGRSFGPFRSGGPLTLVLARATGRVHGVVRDAQGRPVAGAAVAAGEWWKAGAATTTDAEGRYALLRAWAGLVDVAAYASGFQAAFGRAPAAGPDGDSRLDLVLEPGRRVRGRVVDAATGRGIGGAVLDAQDAPGAPPCSGPDGAFEVFLAPDDIALEAQAPGYARGGAPIEEGSGDVEGVVLELRPFVTYEGIVFDEQGKPLADAEVWAWPGARTRSGPGGVFRVQGADPVAADQAPCLCARAGERMPALAAVALSRRDGYHLRLGPVTALQGRVVDEAGDPVAGARLGVTLIHGPLVGRGIDALAAGLERPFAYFRAQADLDGRFRLPGLPEGTYRVSARRDEDVGGASSATGSLLPGEASAELRIVLEPGRLVTGSVRDEAGAVVGARVRVTCGNDLSTHLESDHEGRWRKDGLPPGNVAVRVEHPDHVAAEGLIGAEQDSLDMVLQRRPPSRRIRLVLAGEPIEDGVRLRLSFRSRPQGGAHAHAFPHTQAGSVELELDLPEGIYEVHAQGTRFCGRLEGLVLGPGEGVAQGVLALLPTLTVGGRVMDHDGRAIAGAQVQAAQSFDGWHVPVRTDAEGRFVLGGLLPGEFQVTAWATGYEGGSLRVPAGEAAVSLTLHPLVGVEGRVDLSGPLRGEWRIRIAAVGEEDDAERDVAVGSDGSFHLLLRPGAYEARAVRGQGAQAGRLVAFEVRAGSQVRGLVLEAPPLGLGITGRLLEAGGGPAGGVSLEAMSTTGSATGSHSTSTDYAGHFEFAGLPAGRYRLQGRTAQGRVFLDDVVAGTEGLLLRASAFARISGRVRFSPDAKPEPCEVWARQGDRGHGLTASRGSFEFDDLEAGTYVLLARAGGYVTRTPPTITLAPGERRDGVVLDLVPGGVIEGQVLGADGAPVVGARVSARGPGGHYLGAEAGSDQGRFRLEGLFEGSWELTAMRPHSAPFATLQVEVDLGRTQTVRLVEAAK